MRSKKFFGIFFCLALMTSAAFGSMVENSRQGFDPTISVFASSDEPAETGLPPGYLDMFTLNLWQDFDTWHYGRHFGKVLTPHLFAGRRFDGFTGNYFNRNRYYQPKYGRFSSRDPIGFDGGNNLFSYANQNPLRWEDSFGLKWVIAWLRFYFTTESVEKITYFPPPVTVPYFGPVNIPPIVDPRSYSDYYSKKVDFWLYEAIWVPEVPTCSLAKPPYIGSAQRFKKRISISRSAYNGFVDTYGILGYRNTTEDFNSARSYDGHEEIDPPTSPPY